MFPWNPPRLDWSLLPGLQRNLRSHHIHRGKGYIDICIYTHIHIHIYILYTFAHTHTTYVYNLHIYHQTLGHICKCIYMYIYIYIDTWKSLMSCVRKSTRSADSKTRKRLLSRLLMCEQATSLDHLKAQKQGIGPRSWDWPMDFLPCWLSWWVDMTILEKIMFSTKVFKHSTPWQSKSSAGYSDSILKSPNLQTRCQH